MRLKVAVIGCGDAARVGHLPWYAMNRDVEVVGLVDSTLSQAEYCADRWGGRCYTEVGEMLVREQPDVVSVCTPVHCHAAHTLQCAEAGCHVLCEKPMAPTLEECQKMIDAAQENGVRLGLGFMRRFNPGYALARDLVLSGGIGRVFFARGFWIVNVTWSGFRVQLSTGGGVFQDCASHFIDLFRWLLGTEFAAIQGLIDLYRPEASAVEDHAVALAGFANGASGTIETSWVGPSSYVKEHLEETWIYGSEGTVKVDFPSSPYGVAKVEVWDRKTGEWRLLPMRPFDKRTFENCHYKRLVDEFVACVRENRAFTPSGEDGYKAIEVVLALYQAWYSGRKVSLPLAQEVPVSEIFARLHEQSLRRESGGGK
jgi:predicted dehydrogenase